jgi:hypothetical protein
MGRRDNLACIGVGAMVLAFMALGLAITSAGTARFAVALGYPAGIGYAVGTILDLGKAILAVGLLMLAARRAFLLFAVIGLAWVGLVTFTGLATSATVGSALAGIERNGTWGMETRTNAETELARVEQRMGALSKPAPPRPAATVAQALLREHVPAGVWRDSQECKNIRTSRHFQTECDHVLRLRQELAAARDYEGLEARARELRHALSKMPILAVQDPLPRVFAATLGRLVPVDGEGRYRSIADARHRDHQLLRPGRGTRAQDAAGDDFQAEGGFVAAPPLRSGTVLWIDDAERSLRDHP